MADFGLTFLGLHTVYLSVYAFNQRGHRAYLKAGFKEAGRIRQAFVFNGVRYDRILMDCTREDLGPSRLSGLVGQL
jgi:RimJ/RimL family protein N-acetyltransferase